MDTRARIVAEATRQLTRSGYASFTIAGVRDALDLSSGSMFHAFSSKPALAAAVYVENMAEYQRAALASLRRTSDPKRGICAWISAHLGWIEDHREVARYLFSTLPDDVLAEVTPALAEHNAAFFAALEQLFDAAAAAGLMGRLERRVAQVICIGPAHEYGRQWTRGDVAISPRKLTRTLQRAALAGLAATRTAKETP